MSAPPSDGQAGPGQAEGPAAEGPAERLREPALLERTLPTAVGRPGEPDRDGSGDDLDLSAGDVVAHYELIRPLGRGGMGQVFLARDTKLGRLVALKFFVDRDGEQTQHFLVEARATARLHHENVVVIHEVGEHLGRPYLVLEYLEGKTLREWHRQHLRRVARADGASEHLSPQRAIELMLPVVRALDHAHERDIVHRDLKPSNILITDSGTVKVLDFGIAKVTSVADPAPPSATSPLLAAHPEFTFTGRVSGTMPYMAPEQWNGAHVDPRVDIWAVGVILYELVTGRHPVGRLAPSDLQTVGDLDTAIPKVSDTRPGLGRLGALIDRCLLKRKDQRIASARELLQELEMLQRRQRAPSDGEERSPYPGLGAFQREDAERFFGRARAVDEVVARLAERPLVAVVGPSGAGKSSFIRAGVIPALERLGESWEALTLRPGVRPLEAIAEILLHRSFASEARETREAEESAARDRAPQATTGDRGQRAARLRAEPGYLGARLRTRARARQCHIALFIDQFEELYTLADEADRAAFFACLAGVADHVGSPLRVILSMRSDFLDQIAEEHAAMTGFSRGLTLLTPMDRAGLRDALVRPLDVVGYRFESDDLIEDMLDELAQTTGALPLLQFTAARLWERRDREQRVLSRASYREVGGVAGTLAGHADAVLAAMSAHERTLTRAFFLRLVTPQRTRALVRENELIEVGRDLQDQRRDPQPEARRRARADAPRDVLRRLIDARLLSVESSDERDSLVELVHESLIESWPTLARWLSENQDDAAFLARLGHAAREWRATGRPDGLLWRGRAADQARRWLSRYPGQLAAAEKQFLAAVFSLARRSRRQRQWLIAGAFAVLAFFAVAMSYLAWQRGTAQRTAKAEARRAQSAALQAQREAARTRDAARLAAAREYQDDPTTVLALLREVEAPAQARGFSDLAHRALQSSIAEVVLGGHRDVVTAAVFSPDGTQVVTAAIDGALHLWRADGRAHPRPLEGHQGRIRTVVFSADGTRILSASTDGTARVWNARDSEPPLVLRGHQGLIYMAAFSPDDTRIVTSGQDNTARVWRTDGRAPPMVLRGHGLPVYNAGFSPDGTRVATASQDATARIWRIDDPGPPIVLQGHEQPVMSSVFSPDGTRVLTASLDRTARIFRADGAGPAIVLQAQDQVWSAAWSPDGRQVLTLTSEPVARIFRADGNGEPIRLQGHTGEVRFANWSPDGTRVITASVDKTARIWHRDGAGASTLLTGHDGKVVFANFSPDGSRVVTASDDRTARIWATESPTRPTILSGHQQHVHDVAFDPVGSRVVTASDDTTARLWSLDGHGVARVFHGHAGMLEKLSIRADGQCLATASRDASGRIWPLRGDGEGSRLGGHTDEVLWVAFSPDGQRVATASVDHDVRIWRVGAGCRPVGDSTVLRGHTGAVVTVGFSPDSRRVVTASRDGTARIWRVDGERPPVVSSGHRDWLRSAHFDAAGARVVTASDDHTVRVWRADGSGSPIVLSGHSNVVGWAEFSADGRHVVSGSSDHTARVWNADGRGQPVVLRGHHDGIWMARFSPDGTRVVTASTDMTARLWNADGSGGSLILAGHTDTVRMATFSPDGSLIATGSFDSTARIWRHPRTLGADPDKLWRATTYCMPVARRRDLLGVSQDIARQNHQRCQARVAATR